MYTKNPEVGWRRKEGEPSRPPGSLRTVSRVGGVWGREEAHRKSEGTRAAVTSTTAYRARTTFVFSVLKAESPRSRPQQSRIPLSAWREGSVLDFSPWLAKSYLHIVFLLCAPLCLNSPVLWGLQSHWTKIRTNDLILINPFFKNPIFKYSHILRSQGLELQQMNFKRHNLTSTYEFCGEHNSARNTGHSPFPPGFGGGGTLVTSGPLGKPVFGLILNDPAVRWFLPGSLFRSLPLHPKPIGFPPHHPLSSSDT